MVVELRNIKITVEYDTNKNTHKKVFEYNSEIDDSFMDVIERASDWLESQLEQLG